MTGVDGNHTRPSRSRPQEAQSSTVTRLAKEAAAVAQRRMGPDPTCASRCSPTTASNSRSRTDPPGCGGRAASNLLQKVQHYEDDESSQLIPLQPVLARWLRSLPLLTMRPLLPPKGQCALPLGKLRTLLGGGELLCRLVDCLERTVACCKFLPKNMKVRASR